ncbi:MAG: hypothetical protein JW882_12185 [Deltaproteobacteria bacterium]|nr:hypothetical protein [Deltaproteobacteria bacterium]
MAKALYDQYFIRGPKPGMTNDFLKRYTAMLDDDVIKGSFFFNCTFMQPKYSTGIHGPHIHPYTEMLFFHGLDPENPSELGWEIDLYMGPEFERHTVTKTTVIIIPPGFIHCPIISRMKKPVFHIYCMNGPLLVSGDYPGIIKQEGAFERKYDKHFISGPAPDETDKLDKGYTTYSDDDVFKGSCYFASAFVSNDNPISEQDLHTHPYGTVMGFFGNNPDDQFNLGAEVEITMGKESEKHLFDQSTLVYVPPGLEHRLTQCKVNRPFIFVEYASGPKLSQEDI